MLHRNADDGEYWVSGDLYVVPGKVMESEVLRDGKFGDLKLNNSLPVGDQDEVTVLIKIRRIHPGVLGR